MSYRWRDDLSAIEVNGEVRRLGWVGWALLRELRQAGGKPVHIDLLVQRIYGAANTDDPVASLRSIASRIRRRELAGTPLRIWAWRGRGSPGYVLREEVAVKAGGYQQQPECPQCGNELEGGYELSSGSRAAFDCPCGARVSIDAIMVYDCSLEAVAVSQTHVPG